MPEAPRAAILGLGIMGGSLGLALRSRGLAHVVGWNRSSGPITEALRLGAVDEAASTPAAAAEHADLVILCSPPGVIARMLDEIAPAVAEGAMVTDVGGVKQSIVAAGERALGGRFLGGHPMAGSERSGIANSHADLFVGATWALTPTARTLPEALARGRALADACGAKVLLIPPEEHDASVSIASQLPHVLAYGLRAAWGGTAPALAAASFRDATRVSASPPDLWAELITLNAPVAAQTIRVFRDWLGGVEAAIAAGDRDRLADLLAEGQTTPGSVG